jgi:hypothetical protein
MAKSNTQNFLAWNKEELFNQIDNLEIFRQGDSIITKYCDRIINTTAVSKLYEVFDIRNFLKSKIDQIENNFTINFYRFKMKRGVQELTLLSDAVEINSIKFYKSFYILNSSDKSRRLNINMGLFRADNNSYFVGNIKNLSLSKKHLRGVTDLAEEVSSNIDVESFDEQIAAINSLIGQRVLLSNIKQIVVDKDLKINHKKFDALKNQIRFSKIPLSDSQLTTITTPSEKLEIDYKNDFSIDAFSVFTAYLQVFSNQDSYVVKKETEKIMKITQCFVRAEKINQILDLLA